MKLFNELNRGMWKIAISVLVVNIVLTILLLIWYSTLIGMTYDETFISASRNGLLTTILKNVIGYLSIVGLTILCFINLIGTKRELYMKTIGKIDFLKLTYYQIGLIAIINSLIWLSGHVVSFAFRNINIRDFAPSAKLFSDIPNDILMKMGMIIFITIVIFTIALYIKDKYLNNQNKYKKRKVRMVSTSLLILRMLSIAFFAIIFQSQFEYITFENRALNFQLGLYFLDNTYSIILIFCLSFCLIIDYVYYYIKEVTI